MSILSAGTTKVFNEERVRPDAVDNRRKMNGKSVESDALFLLGLFSCGKFVFLLCLLEKKRR